MDCVNLVHVTYTKIIPHTHDYSDLYVDKPSTLAVPTRLLGSRPDPRVVVPGPGHVSVEHRCMHIWP